jgi:ATP-dependent Lon protease
MALCEVLGLPFGFVSLAGINGEPFFTGFSYCYEGSRCGRIADILTTSQCMNPILYFDELDKVSTTSHGEEIANFLVHLTDFSQNHKFQDKYFGDIDMDLSKCIIIFSYNHEELINPILKDRMITIRTKGYDSDDKVKLARDYMLPKIFKEFGFKNGDLVFEEDTIRYIIEKIDDEKGARNMNRAFEEIVGTINFKRLLGEEKDFPMVITTKIVDKYIVITKKVKDNTSAQMMYL